MINFYKTLAILLLLGLGGFTEIFAQKNKKTETKPPSDSKKNFQAMRWRNIGPFRGGRSVTATGIVQNTQVYYFGGTGGGVWKTEDAGITWRNISDGFFKTGSVGIISVAESDPNVIYVGMGEHAVRGVMTSYGDGVYKSTDAGKTWKQLGLEKTRHIAQIRIHPQNPDIVYVAAQGALHGKSSERGIYKSTDGGLTWKKTLYIDENTGAADLSMDMSNPRIMYATTWEHIRYPWQVKSGGAGSAIYKSDDAGETWQKLSEGLPAEMGKAGVSVSRANPNRVYAVIEAKEGLGGVYRSDDAGKKWQNTSKDRATIARAWYYNEVYADTQNPDVVYVMNAPFLKSIDGGRTFTEIPVPHGDNHDLWIHPQNNQLMINANDGGANVSFNGGKSWSSQQQQPTAQFYRVITDNRFPYYVYGGQQDNTSVAIVSRTNGLGITWKDWYTSAGCESAYLAFNPDDPRYVLGGCYQGIIEVFDHKTEETKSVMAYPFLGLATAPKDQKYRFNWNAPILASQHNPNAFYHGGNVVFKTQNLGQSWEAISQDLTRNDKSKQEFGGAPFTNEGAGGEVYGTIMYLAESKHEKGTLWVGSDDGLVHLTRDEGKTWQNVTPKGLEETMINSIEVSPHDKASVYVVATRYKFNDFSPSIYKSSDYGKTWQKITNGIKEEDFVRVVREDPKRRGLLYAGAENGFYISYNDGQSWQSLQLNLPVVPITDLAIRNNDLVAATAGRSFWILDDLSVFQQFQENIAQKPWHLYTPRPTYRLNGGSTEEMPNMPQIPGLGTNPPNGVLLFYQLAEKIDTTQTFTLEILAETGEILKTFNNQKKKDFVPYSGGPGVEPLLPTQAGLNRFVWNLRVETLPNVPRVFVLGDYRGHKVAPGIYQARLKWKDLIESVKFEVLADPRLEVSASDFARQQELLHQIENSVREIHQNVNSMRKARQQVELMLDILKEMPDLKQIADSGKVIIDKIKGWENQVIQPQQKTFQDVINFPNRLNADFLHLKDEIDTHDPRPTQGVQDRLRDLQAEWVKQKTNLQKVINEDVKNFEKLYRDKNLPVILIPKKEGQKF
jgi:photosystem II stability/assembly factor-like uncharacterized protein